MRTLFWHLGAYFDTEVPDIIDQIAANTGSKPHLDFDSKRSNLVLSHTKTSGPQVVY